MLCQILMNQTMKMMLHQTEKNYNNKKENCKRKTGKLKKENKEKHN